MIKRYVYSEEFDAFYDAVDDEWTESKCDDPACKFCTKRPEKPSHANLAKTKTRYWTICYPGEWGQNVQETFSEDQILKSYFPHWFHKMVEANKHDHISNENCIEDWKIVHWAWETDEFGEKIGN